MPEGAATDPAAGPPVLCAPNAEAARGFYSTLFGWTVAELPRTPDGVRFALLEGGRDVATITQAPQDALDLGSPAEWMPRACFDVDQLPETVARALELGALGPGDHTKDGLRLTDPQGATFCIRELERP